jgi:hypothetical protein
MTLPTVAAWVNESTDPDVDKARRHGITDLYFAARNQDGRINDDYLKRYRDLGFTCGIYWSDTWDPDVSGVRWAEIVNNYWRILHGNISFLKVQFNIEVHDQAKILNCFNRWRDLRPHAVTSWAMEGFQGGWIKSIAADLVRLGITCVPEAYDGAMNPFDPRAVVHDLTANGVPENMVIPFMGANDVHRGLDQVGGFIFQLAELS